MISLDTLHPISIYIDKCPYSRTAFKKTVNKNGIRSLSKIISRGCPEKNHNSCFENFIIISTYVPIKESSFYGQTLVF